MRKKLHIPCLVFMIMMALSTKAQNNFSKVYYDSLNAIYGFSIAPALDGGSMIAGSINGEGLVMKLDSLGAIVWSKSYVPYGDLFCKIIPTKDSGFFVAGSNADWVGGFDSLLCIKLDTSGNILWSRTFDAGKNDIAYSVAQTFDGGYILTGHADSITFNRTYSKIVLLKLDASGNLMWKKIIVGGTFQNNGASVIQLSDSGFALTGYMEDSTSLIGYAYVMKLDAAGTIAWTQKYFDSTEVVQGLDIAEAPGGMILYLLKGYESLLMKIDLNGNVMWNRSYSIYTTQWFVISIPPRMKITHDNGIAFVNGTSASAVPGPYVLCKVDSNGLNPWAQDITLIPLDFSENPDGSFTVVGNGPIYGLRTASTSHEQIGVMRIDSTGNNFACNYQLGITVLPDSLDTATVNLTVTSVGTLATSYSTMTPVGLLSDSGCVPVIGGFPEIQDDAYITVFPNPASSSINFSFAKSARQFNLTICNVMGQEVYSKLLTGEETRNFSMVNTFPPGMYIAVLRDDRFVYSKKILIE